MYSKSQLEFTFKDILKTSRGCDRIGILSFNFHGNGEDALFCVYAQLFVQELTTTSFCARRQTLDYVTISDHSIKNLLNSHVKQKKAKD